MDAKEIWEALFNKFFSDDSYYDLSKEQMVEWVNFLTLHNIKIVERRSPNQRRSADRRST